MELKFKHFIILQGLDVLTTYIALTYIGLSEGNIFLNSMFQHYGFINTLIMIKLVGLMVIYGWISVCPLVIKITNLNIKSYIVRTWSLNFACLLYFIVVLNNSYQMIKVI